MFAHERHQLLLQRLQQEGRIEAATLGRELGASPATLRRDLEELELQGKLVRVHGGAIHPASLRAEPSLLEKANRHTPAKQAIAVSVAALIPDHATVFVDSGSSCLEAARVLLRRPSLTILTNSIPVLACYRVAQAKLVAIGGEIRVLTGALVGADAQSWMEKLHPEFALIGASGLDLTSGASTTELTERALKQAAIRASSEAWLLSDASKWERPSTFNFAAWSDFTRFLTETPPPKKFRPPSELTVSICSPQPL